MSIPGVIKGKRSQLFRALEQRMRADKALKRAVKTWKSWTGLPTDAAEFVAGELVGVRLTPVVTPARPQAVGLTYSPLQIHIEIVLPALNADDTLDLWEAFEDCLWPGDGRVAALLNQHGAIATLELVQPGYTFKPETGSQQQKALAVVEASYLARTAL